MLRGMTASQFAEWRAYADLEPFDETRADLRTADVVRTLININRKKGTPPISLDKCLLRFEPVRKRKDLAPKTVEQARAQVRRTLDIMMLIFNAPEKPKRVKRLGVDKL
jgi:hypothetical protein